MKKLVVYHTNCPDGFCACWLLWRAFGDAAEYVPAQYGDPPPDVEGREVWVVDFSYPRAVLLEMASKAASLRVLDHHRSAQQELADLPFASFDMERSGAMMTWDALHPGELAPRLVQYVQDRDLWRWKLPYSREVSAWLSCQEKTFSAWEEAYRKFETSPVEAIRFGFAVLAGIDRYVRDMQHMVRRVRFAGHNVAAINCPGVNASELLGVLAEQEGVDFALGWHQRADGVYQYSLRGTGAVDVSEIAKARGGGGHRNAAGFESAMVLDVLLTWEAGQ